MSEKICGEARTSCASTAIKFKSVIDRTPKANNFVYFLIFICIIIAMLFLFGCGEEDNADKPIVSSGEREPVFSPDGKYIAYSIKPQYEIFLFEMATEESEYLTDGSLPDWSPDGKEIIYVKDANIYKINVETKEIRQLTTWGDCFFPDWAPNGVRIAFDTGHDDPKGAHMLWLMDTNGTNFKDISIHGTGEWREAEWSPSGNRLAHIRYIGVTFREIFVMDSSGQNSVRLTNNQVDDYHPAWSPDGSKIIYVSATHIANEMPDYFVHNIWVMDTKGTDKTQLTWEYGNYNGAYNPTWSPDGNQIAYVKGESFEKKNEIEIIYNLWMMDADGGNKRQLTGKVIETFGCK